MDQNVIGRNIQKWRAFKTKKQQTFANEIGVPRIMLSRYKMADQGVSIEKLEQIARSLGVTLKDLIEGAGSDS